MSRGDVVVPQELLGDLRELIEEARHSVAQAVNSTLVLLHWRIGKRISDDILVGKRAGYGKGTISAISAQLSREFGRGFGSRNLFRMVRFTEVYPDLEIVSALMTQLGWTHFLHIIPLEDPLKRDFYAEMCRVERWSTRTLEKKIDGMLYERTALSKKSDEVIRHELETLREQDRITPDLVFKDPYFLDFLQLNDRYLEKDLEDAILREMEQFILELGSGFAFVARQKRIQIDSDDFYIDLLFFHRKLKRLVAVELKLGKFKAAYKGQMELYLRWLDENERQPDELGPLGLILCASKAEEQIRLLQLEHGDIRVASYMTELPPRKLLEKKLHEAVRIARQRSSRKEVR